MRTSFTTIINASELSDILHTETLVIVDCRFDISNPENGRKAYKASHVPGAVYAHLDEDLSGPIKEGKTGRHPLPDLKEFCDLLGTWGIEENSQVVVYDDKAGAMAARLWWLLKFLGHEKAAVMNGGWHSWEKHNFPISKKTPAPLAKKFNASIQHDMLVDMLFINENINRKEFTLIDSRARERYLGEIEPLDSVAGHIPGAVNLPFIENIGPDKEFLDQDILKNRFSQYIDPEAEAPIFYCGSGVTACHNILAYAHAGLGIARLFAGSWSEWITDPDNPIE